MSIRPAKFADIPACYALMEEAYQRSVYVGRDEIDAKEAKRLLAHSVQRAGGKTEGSTTFFVSEQDGELTGFILGMLDRVYHVGKKLTATDLFFFQREGAPGIDAAALLAQFMGWAAGNPNVIEVRLGTTNIVVDDTRAEKLYERMGFTRVGSMWEWRIGAEERAA